MKPQKKILIVDDQPINRKILGRLLSDTYLIEEAPNGREAISVLTQCGSDISAILLDLCMPVMDGYQFLQVVSQNTQWSAIPVIVVSQADKTQTEATALQLGARDFISKPYNAGVLRRRLANLIELYESNICIGRIEHDTLTGLYNKDAFCRHASELLASRPASHYILVATDVERFKLVNDSFGTAEGDKLLHYIGQSLAQDVQAAGGLCARHNSDHFVAIVPQNVDDGNLQSVIAKAQKVLAQYPLNMKISLKFGVYPVDDLETPVSLMCDRAILAAENAKGHYNNPCAYYDDSIRQQLQREQKITDAMKTSLLNGEFMVYLQPKYNLSNCQIAGAEALVRWNHPTLGFLSPAEFIPLFERNGFITELDEYIWDQTCLLMESWQNNGQKTVPVSVNVSRKDIYKADLPQLLSRLVHKHGLRAEQLHLEITETAYTENAEQLVETVGRLKQLGFPIEMDDFGSGYSSLNMISELPIDILKLDMRFIQRETVKNNSRNILHFIIGLAKCMQLLVVAEGVETQDQVTLLQSMGCDYVQGYYYARPMPAGDFATFLNAAPA